MVKRKEWGLWVRLQAHGRDKEKGHGTFVHIFKKIGGET